ncbi:nSTAND1 domain-containing NTPase [Nonomuraea sp. NPDC003214]
MTSNGSDPKPYVGAHPFRREDAARFHGRDREAEHLAECWENNRLTILHGAPGTGKSSLVAAGVLPRLAHSRLDVLPVGSVLRPASVPAALIPAECDPFVFSLLSSWTPNEAPIAVSGLTVSACLRQRWSPGGRPVLAALDPADDVFTAHHRGPAARTRVLDQLADALADDKRLRLLVVVDDDHLDGVRKHAGLREHLTGTSLYALRPLEAGAALKACREPAAEAGVPFAPGAAVRLVGALQAKPWRGPVEPVHLQLVCSSLWEAVRGLPLITEAELVDVDAVLADFVHRQIEDVAADHYDGKAEHLFALVRRIAEPGDAGPVELPSRVAWALTARHVLRPGERRRHEIPERLAGPVLNHRFRPRGGRGRTPGGLLLAAEDAVRRGWFDLAVALAGDALRADAGDVRLRARAESLLADLAHERGDLDDAVRRYRAAAQLHTTVRGSDQIVATLLTTVGRILIAGGAFREAVGELRAAVRRSPNPLIQTELAWALWHLGNPRGAVDVLDGALASQGATQEALRARGEILSDLAEPGKALRDLNRVMPHEQPSTQAAYALALAQTGHVKQAVSLVEPLGVESDGPTLLRAAQVMAADENLSEAAKLARRAWQGANRRRLPPHLTATAERLM